MCQRAAQVYSIRSKSSVTVARAELDDIRDIPTAENDSVEWMRPSTAGKESRGAPVEVTELLAGRRGILCGMDRCPNPCISLTRAALGRAGTRRAEGRDAGTGRAEVKPPTAMVTYKERLIPQSFAKRLKISRNMGAYTSAQA
jgi:hypothetical protein